MSDAGNGTERQADTEASQADRGIGPRHAAGNKGWNEPADEEPQTIEDAVGDRTGRSDEAASDAPGG